MLDYSRMDKYMNKNAKNSPIVDYYTIIFNGYPCSEKVMANYLNMNLTQYINIIKKCGAKFIKDGYYFIKEDDAIKAVITLKLMAA